MMKKGNCNLNHKRDEQVVYTCMLCNTQYYAYPSEGICDVCGMPIDRYKVKYTTQSCGYAITIKISDEKAIRSMQNGTFWFQSPKYYQSFADNDVIGDVNESVFYKIIGINNVKDTDYGSGKTIKYEGRIYTVDKIIGDKLYLRSPFQNCFRLFCMYRLQFDTKLKLLTPDPRIKKFGNCFAVINSDIIAHRIKTIINSGTEFIDASIKYVSNNYEGFYSPSCKFDKYKYQQEYRFILCSLDYDKLPAMKKKVIDLQLNNDEQLLSDPAPIELLWEMKDIYDLEKYLGLKLEKC